MNLTDIYLWTNCLEHQTGKHLLNQLCVSVWCDFKSTCLWRKLKLLVSVMLFWYNDEVVCDVRVRRAVPGHHHLTCCCWQALSSSGAEMSLGSFRLSISRTWRTPRERSVWARLPSADLNSFPKTSGALSLAMAKATHQQWPKPSRGPTKNNILPINTSSSLLAACLATKDFRCCAGSWASALLATLSTNL